MGRDELKAAAESGGFVEYGKEQLPKIDSMRRDKTQPDFYGVPIMSDSQAGLTSAEDLGNRPASCYTCLRQNSDLCCNLMGPGVKVEKVTGSRDSGDPIEYWPCCDEHSYCSDVADGKRSKPNYAERLEMPRNIGLIWINAPKPGQKFGGANCGGVNGGDDCDHYIVYGKKEKWDVESAYCRVLAHDVPGGWVCRIWHDDDELQFEEAQMLIKGDSMDTVEKKRFVKSLISRDED